MNRSSELAAPHLAAFRQVIIARRGGRRYEAVASAVAPLLPETAEPPPADWFRDLERKTRRPLSNVLRLDAYLRVLGATWPEVLWALGARASMEHFLVPEKDREAEEEL